MPPHWHLNQLIPPLEAWVSVGLSMEVHGYTGPSKEAWGTRDSPSPMPSYQDSCKFSLLTKSCSWRSQGGSLSRKPQFSVVREAPQNSPGHGGWCSQCLSIGPLKPHSTYPGRLEYRQLQAAHSCATEQTELCCSEEEQFYRSFYCSH